MRIPVLATLVLTTALTATELEQCGGGTDTPTPTPTPTPEASPTPELHDDDLGYTCDLSFPSLPSIPSFERSLNALPSSNGYVGLTYAVELSKVPVQYADGSTGTFNPKHRLIGMTDHLMAKPDSGSTTRDLLYDLYLGVRIDGVGTWLGDIAESEIGYEDGTGIIRLVQKVNNIEIETHYFAPMQGDSYAMVVQARVINRDTKAHTVDLYSIQNFHTGGEGHADGEQVSSTNNNAILETRNSDRLIHYPIELPTHRAAAPSGDSNNPYSTLLAGRDLSDQLLSGNDVAAGFQWSLGGGSLDPGEETSRGLVVGFNGTGEDNTALTSRLVSFVNGRTSSSILQAERDFWTTYHAVEQVPAGLDSNEQKVFRQSTAVLKMAQVREPGSGYGQLLASLPPGIWNISWPRDAAYAIVALVRSGHYSEAKSALSFMIQGNAGKYAAWLGISDYLISACRYYGNGEEESDNATCSDGRSAGPNIELDDFGLFLWAWTAYIEASGDNDFFIQTRDPVRSGVADVLVSLIDPDNDLLKADSSIWERHWESCFPNGRKHFSYSSLQAVSGLRRFAELTGESTYSDAASRIRGGLLSLSGGPVFESILSGQACPVLASAPEEICTYCGPYDASVIDGINQGVIDPDSALAAGTLYSILTRLGMGNGSPGFKRADDGTGTSNTYPWYDDQEWVVIDLRLASALYRMGVALNDGTLITSADRLQSWITQQAISNYALIPELLSDGKYTSDDDADYTDIGKDSGFDYQGAVPMAGFGAGAYVLTAFELSGQ